MKLYDWLKKNDLKPYKWSMENGVGMAQVYNHIYRNKGLSLALARRISELTDEEVSLEELMITDGEVVDMRRSKK